MIRKAKNYQFMDPAKKQKLSVQNAEKYRLMKPNKKQELKKHKLNQIAARKIRISLDKFIAFSR